MEQPLAAAQDRIIVQPFDPDRLTSGGIILPDNAQEPQDRGEVLAVGPGMPAEGGRWRHVLARPGDVVIYGRYSGTEIKVEGEPVRVMRECEVIAFEQPDPPLADRVRGLFSQVG